MAKVPTPDSTSLASLAAVAILVLLTSPLQADKVWLANGNFLEGSADILENGDVSIETAAGTMTIPASSVSRVERTESQEQRVAGFLRRHPSPGADTLYQLGIESRDAGSTTLALQLFARALEADPDHIGARRALGYRSTDDGRWVTEEEWHALRGEVYYDGRWISTEARDRILQANAERRAAEAQARLELARRAAAEAERQAQIQAQEQSYGIPYWYVWTPSGVPIYPPGYGPRPEHPIAPPTGPGLPNVRGPAPLPEPPPPQRNSSRFRPPG